MAGGRPAQGQRPLRVDQRGEGLVSGDGLQPPGHRTDGYECRGREHEQEHDRYAGRLGRLGVGGAQPQGDESPGQGVGERRHQPDSGEEAGRAGVDPEADGEPDRGHDHHDEQVAGQVGDGASGEDGAARHGQRAEPLQQPRPQVIGQADGGAQGTEGDRLSEHAGDQVVDVGHPGNADRAAERIPEQQHEHDRLDGGEDQSLRCAGQVAQVAAGDVDRVGDGHGDPAGGGFGGGDGCHAAPRRSDAAGDG